MYSKKFARMHGQGLVEFALLLPVLLILIIGTLDLGSAFFIKVGMENSAREGAYFMVFNTVEGKASDFALTKAAVQIEAEGSGLTLASDNIEVECRVGAVVNNACPSGSTVVVTVRYDLTLAIDFFSGGPIEMVSEARMMIP